MVSLPWTSRGFRKQAGSTLVDILAAIAIVSILTAILLPVLMSARKRSGQADCLSNLRQLGASTFAYCQDYDDHFPYGGDPSDLDTDIMEHWRSGEYWPQVAQMQINHLYLNRVMAAYVSNNNIWHCPEDDGFLYTGSFEDDRLNAGASAFQTYGMSYKYMVLLALDAETISSINGFDRRAPFAGEDYDEVWLYEDLSGSWHGDATYAGGRYNIAMVDGHAISVSRARERQINEVVFRMPPARSNSL